MKDPKTVVFAYNTVFETLDAFSSPADAITHCEGLEVAEGDWLFFDVSGGPLEAHFHKPAYVDTTRNVYGNGTYTLKPGQGHTLHDILFDLCRAKKGVWIGSQQDLKDRLNK